MTHWAFDSFFYHIYPLGFCGAPERNDFSSPSVPRLEKIYAWLDHVQTLGANALYLGPLFESSTHGYDTRDYYHVDRRLGEDSTLVNLSRALHQRGLRLVLDGVFNHVGRDFWAFRDVQGRQRQSPYWEWFQDLDFNGCSPYGDPFSYQGWSGHYDLVKLNLRHPAVKEHLFQAVAAWVRDFGIDGLRLDAADTLDFDFMRELAAFCRSLRPDFWLFGEVVHGDYRRWANPQMLDATTNYECYKGLYSSLVDQNYFEIAYALNRQFGDSGLYAGLPLYAFADNHDVNRVASQLTNPAHLYPLYCLLFTMPGVPSLYYGSEWGIEGKRTRSSDRALRPNLDLNQAAQSSPNRDLARTISRLAAIRRASPALRLGRYRQLAVAAEQFAFLREASGETAVVLLNASNQPVQMELPAPFPEGSTLEDRLNPGEEAIVQAGVLKVKLMPCWGRILTRGSIH